MRGLQGAIDRARVRALDSAARAADNTLAAFAQTCHVAIVDGDPHGAGVGSYAELAEHCRELQQQWQQTPLRPRLPALEGRMAQYGVYETVCGVMTHTPDGMAGIFFNAEQLHQAATLSRRAFEGAPGALDDRLRAFRKSCTVLRSTMLEEVIQEEVDAAQATYNELDTRLQQALTKSAAVAISCDTLLSGNPLAPAQAREPGSPAALAQGPRPALPEADQSLIDAACQVAHAAREQREQAIELPGRDLPQRALHAQQGGLALLYQMELTAGTAAAVLTSFNHISATLDTTPPEAQPDLLQRHTDAMEQRVLKLHKAVQEHYATFDGVSDPQLRAQVAHSQAMLRVDLRLARRMHLSLTTLGKLLAVRQSARLLLGELEQDPRPALDQARTLADRPEFNGKAHSAIARELNKGLKQVMHDLLQEKPKIPPEDWWDAEKCRHGVTTSAMGVKIGGEWALIKAQLLLALSDHLPEHREMVAELFDSLTGLNKTLKELAATSECKAKYLEQCEVNDKVRRALLELNLKLASLDPVPTVSVAAGSSASDEPAARPSGATSASAETSKGNKSSRLRRRATHR